MQQASVSRLPDVSVIDCLAHPARSTKFKIDFFVSVVFPNFLKVFSCKENIAWDLLLVLFILVSAVVLHFVPIFYLIKIESKSLKNTIIVLFYK